ncbi:19215_t:CDS:2, partial [Entrophospora sp. SA101]
YVQQTKLNFFQSTEKTEKNIIEASTSISLKSEVADDALLVVLAYNNLVVGNIVPFIKIVKAFLITRSRMSLRSANEPVLQAIVEILLPSRYHVPELCLVMNSKKQKGSGHFGYLDVFVLGGAEGNNISLELKYISLTGLMRDIKGSSMKKIDANELEKLDKILEKEDEESLLGRKYGQVVGYSAEGVLDERIQIVKSDPNKLKVPISSVSREFVLLNKSTEIGSTSSLADSSEIDSNPYGKVERIIGLV